MKISIKRFATGLISISSLVAFSATPAFAGGNVVSICPAGSAFSGVCNFNTSTLLGSVINVVFVIAILIALFFLIYGGIRWIISQGNKEKVNGARDMLIAALVGLIVVFLSYFLLGLVIQLLFGQTTQNLLNSVTSNGIFNSGVTNSQSLPSCSSYCPNTSTCLANNVNASAYQGCITNCETNHGGGQCN